MSKRNFLQNTSVFNMARPYKHSIVDKNNICSEYQKGISTNDLANRYSCSEYCIRRTLKDNNIKIRSRKESRKTNHFINKVSGANSHNWKGGTGDLINKIRLLPKYSEWRLDIYKRDNYTCQECNRKRIKGDRVILQCDHIKPLSLIISENNLIDTESAMNCFELWDINNGRIVCYECHKKTDTWGFSIKNYNRTVLQLNSNDEVIGKFNSVKEASEILGLQRTSINRVCLGEYKTSGGFKFQYE